LALTKAVRIRVSTTGRTLAAVIAPTSLATIAGLTTRIGNAYIPGNTTGITCILVAGVANPETISRVLALSIARQQGRRWRCRRRRRTSGGGGSGRRNWTFISTLYFGVTTTRGTCSRIFPVTSRARIGTTAARHPTPAGTSGRGYGWRSWGRIGTSAHFCHKCFIGITGGTARITGTIGNTGVRARVACLTGIRKWIISRCWTASVRTTADSTGGAAAGNS
jgi:hypothetical protein